MEESARFQELAIGDTFDFILEGSFWNSFYKRCIKVAPRCYQDEDGTMHRIGTVKCLVHHIKRKGGE